MNDAVVLEVIYPYPVERVWRALTDSRALATRSPAPVRQGWMR
jgi:uncharacterized protein YndB with AHSA1/START domain